MKDQDFVILAVAQDAQGIAAAAPWYERAGATFVGLVDEHHIVSSLYNLVNVPSAVWIDEAGQVRRIDEGTYATMHNLGGFEFGRTDYAPMVADWVANSDASTHVDHAIQISEKTSEQAKAEPAFALGVYFSGAGDDVKANHYWAQAQTLNPDSWNYHRQDWAYTPDEAGANWQQKVQTLGDTPYYKPIQGLETTNQ